MEKVSEGNGVGNEWDEGRKRERNGEINER